MTGTISASRAVATIAATQTVEAKKKKRKRVGPTVSADTTTVNYDVETINVNEEGVTPSRPAGQRSLPAETPRKGHGDGRVGVGDTRQSRHHGGALEVRCGRLGQRQVQKRVRRAPPKPIKPGLRSASN
jgi:hypothetical protein